MSQTIQPRPTMGPFKFLGIVFGSLATATTASLQAVESIANTVNVVAEGAHQASKISVDQMLLDMKADQALRKEAE